MNLQNATIDDIPVLSVHHRKMFAEIWEQKGELLSQALAKKLEAAYSAKLGKQIPEGSCKVWVVMDDNQIIASGGITIVSLVPVPSDMNDNIAYLHSMYTEKEYRHKKCAQRIVKRAIQDCRQNGIKRIILHASEAGRPLYEELDFVSSPESMRLFIK